MGLDMYLTGRKIKYTDNEKDDDGLEVNAVEVRLGYWRKHPNLHGFIVQNFAGGVDECQRIFLTEENINAILDATQKKELPETTGFFFGKSQPEDDLNTIEYFTRALRWLNATPDGEGRRVIYHASW